MNSNREAREKATASTEFWIPKPTPERGNENVTGTILIMPTWKEKTPYYEDKSRYRQRSTNITIFAIWSNRYCVSKQAASS